VDVEELLATHGGLITVGIVEAAADSAPRGPLPDPLPVQSGVRRIVLIGAGLGATQVQEIIRSDPTRKAVAIVDDAQKTWGEVVGGVPVIGPPDRMLELHRDGALDGAIIAVGTSVAARARLRKLCDEARLPLESAIDPSARIAAAAQIGAGNVICALCHVGTGTVLGENNFISAYNSFDHHNVIGSDIATGPGCMTSGLVKIGDRCRLGTGVFIEPHVELGAEVTVASGAIIVGSVPARHSVKRRLLTTTVVPRRDL
jgi:hypothetical protein